MAKLSVIIPAFNERENISRIYGELVAVLDGVLAPSREGGVEAEILFTDNHSTDGTPEAIEALIAKDPRVRLIRLSRNFGYQGSILTGYLNATGDVVVQLDADGEDDPAIIPEFIRLWREGYKVVYGVRLTRKESFFTSLQRKIFYRILKSLSSVPIPLDAGDFRLVDRQVVEVIRSFREANPYIRGIIAYSGFKQKGFDYHRRPRYAGESKFSWFDYFTLALDGITSFSRKPLAMATWAGIGLSVLSLLGALFYLYFHFFVGTKLPGFTTLIIVLLLTSGIQLLCLGVAGAYIGRIFEEVKQRPRSIIEYERRDDSDGKRA